MFLTSLFLNTNLLKATKKRILCIRGNVPRLPICLCKLKPFFPSRKPSNCCSCSEWNRSVFLFYFCIMGAFTSIERSHTQIARPVTTTYRPYLYLFRAGIKSATRSAVKLSDSHWPTLFLSGVLSATQGLSI